MFSYYKFSLKEKSVVKGYKNFKWSINIQSDVSLLLNLELFKKILTSKLLLSWIVG